MELKDFLTPKTPLGPFHHEKVLRQTHSARTNLLLCQVGLFDQVIARGSPLVVGRRGSGKTAIVNAFLAAAGHADNSYGRGARGDRSDDIYVFINSWDHLDEIVENVGRDIRYALGTDIDWDSILPETVARKWAQRFWDAIFKQLYREAREGDWRNIQGKVPGIISYFTGEDFLPDSARISDESIGRRVAALRSAVLRMLAENKINCFIVIDSLEVYPVNSPKFLKTIAGFLKCVNEFEDDNPNIKVICCIPEEVEHVIYSKSSNRMKDLATASSVSRLRWKPVELLKVVAQRYRDFLIIHVEDDPEFIDEISSYRFRDRKDLQRFYELVMPAGVTNRFGTVENSLAYIIRHTQLLPREFILLFSRAIVKSHEQKGSWRYIEEEAIVAAVSEQEPELAQQILDPYKPLYPALIDEARKVVCELKPIFSKSDVDKLGARLVTSSRHEVDDPWGMLFEIGIIGYIDNQGPQAPNAIYEYGQFHFNSTTKITFANDRRYCVHPVFSGSWNLRQVGRGDTDKFIYPADVGINVWEG